MVGVEYFTFELFVLAILKEQRFDHTTPGKDWNDVEQNCHQPCPSGNNVECENPEHSCWAFVLACKVDTSIPVDEESSLSPADGPVTSSPNLPVTLESSEAPVPSGEPSILVGLPEAVDNEGEAWESNEGEQIDNEGENFDDEYAESQAVDNEGEAWGSNNQVDNENDDWNQPVDNEGESWDSNSEVNNEGEDWNSSKPSAKPIPASPTGKPTADPTIDLMEHLENMKSSYFCSETWENIDCENAQSCPSGDSKGKNCSMCQTCYYFASLGPISLLYLNEKIVRRNKSVSVARLANPVNQSQTINQPVKNQYLLMRPEMKALPQLRLKQQ